MPNNFLITGPPGSGKTTVLERVSENLKRRGFEVGGMYCPEIRSEGRRMGFRIVDIMTEKGEVLAHVDRDSGPRVGKYRVDVSNVDSVSRSAISRARREADVVMIDEIAPMEVYSEEFRRQVRGSLESDEPLLAVVHKRSTSGFIGEVKDRGDVEMFQVDEETREILPDSLTDKIVEKLQS